MATAENERLERLFSDALAIESWAERLAFLDEACGGDVDVRARVEALLRLHERVGSFLESPPVDPDATLESWAPSDSTGTRIGRYKILQELGEGGFGTVYMAAQEEPVRRQVALKIIKLGMDTRQVIARFEVERQALALMDHPNIAHVLDAGATETGRPYFVMELVKGIAITEYCDRHKLSVRQRLGLFLPVCHAIQHAHQKGVIHRDLKPNNVLVALHENQPSPKVIDFGIAKATSQRLTDKTLVTELRQFIGTPEYMSPDQAEVSRLDIDTRTDIYSLGVLLYELLTGTTPFDRTTLRESSYEEIQRIIREVEPPRPSDRLQVLRAADAAANPARLRQTDPATLLRLIRGDLDWITMKAMEKDRTRRYATAKDLADDIERHLRNEPVLAGPPGAAYKLRKFVRRHRLGVLAGTIASAAVLIGLSLATLGFFQAKRATAEMERQRDAAETARASAQRQRSLAEANATEARDEAQRFRKVSWFLEEMLRSVDPRKALGREVTVRFLLDEAARKIDEGALADQPEVEATVRMTLGETYEALGVYDAAETHLRTAVQMRRALLGERNADTLSASRALAKVLRVTGKFTEAEALLRQTMDTQRRVLGYEHPETLSTMNELALALQESGRLTEAEGLHRRTLQIRRRVLGEEHVDTLESMSHLGDVCRALGNLDEAQTLLGQAFERSRRVLGEEHPCTMRTMNNLGLLFEDQRDYEQAESFYRHAYGLERRVLGPDHPQTLVPMNNLLRVLHMENKSTEIKPLVAERLARLRRAAERPGANALTLHAYAWELLNCELPELRDPEAALPFASRAAEMDRGRDANLLDTLALAYQMTGQLDWAIQTQRRAVARAQAGGPYNQEEFKGRLVNYLLEKGDFVGAARVSMEGLAALGETLIPTSDPGAALAAQSQSLMEQQRFEEALTALRGCLAVRQEALPEGHWLIADTKCQLGRVLAAEGNFADAERWLLEGYAGMEDNRRAPAERKIEALRQIVHLYDSWEKPDEAAAWQLRLQEAVQDSESQKQE